MKKQAWPIFEALLMAAGRAKFQKLFQPTWNSATRCWKQCCQLFWPFFQVGLNNFWNSVQPAGIARTSTMVQACLFLFWWHFQSWKHCQCTWIFKDSCSEERVGSEYCQSSIWLIWNYCKLPQKSFLVGAWGWC